MYAGSRAPIRALLQMRRATKMQLWRRAFCQLRALLSTPPTRWRCTKPGTQEEMSAAHHLADVGSAEAGGSRSRARRKRTRRRVGDDDGSVFAKHGLPQFEKMTREELARHIADSKVHDQDGIIAFNKPASVPVTGGGHNLVNILEILPHLAESVGRPAAEISKAADRDSSGLILLGESKQVARALEDAFVTARRRNQLIRKYWALTVGIPSPAKGTIEIPIGPEKIGDQMMMVPRRHPSKGNFERKEALRCRTDYRVLAANPQLCCSLLELKPFKLQKHQFQVHLCEKLCCILGDRLYSGRIQDILGVPVLVDPRRAAVGTQSLPESVRQALGLRTWHLARLPLFLHWYQVTLSKWHKSRDVSITASPPGYFIEALQRLGLYNQLVEEDIMKNTT